MNKMRYKHFFLLESWKNYILSNNPEVLLYDFYVLSYLTTLPLSPTQKGFAGSLIGRDPIEIKQDITDAEDKLLPFLQKQLSDALFIAICAEIRHILDRRQNWEVYKGNKLLTQYIRNYQLYISNIPGEMMPRSERPPMEVQQQRYGDSYKAAIRAIKDTGSTREQFARLCSDLFKNGNWDSAYGGPKWGEIADAYILLNKTPQTKQQLQIAIDHAYDLQHNTGTVLNKVSNYYIKGDITWLKKALDYKANLKSLYELLPKCSSDMRKLALEAFKTAGIKRPSLETVVPGDVIKVGGKTIHVKKDVDPNLDPNLGNTEMYQKLIKRNIGKKLTFKDENNHFEGIIQDNTGISNNYYVQITKILNDKLFVFGIFNVGHTVAINPLSLNIKIEKATTPTTPTTPTTTEIKIGDPVKSISREYVGKYIHYKSPIESGENVNFICKIVGVVVRKLSEKYDVLMVKNNNPGKAWGWFDVGDKAELVQIERMVVVEYPKIETKKESLNDDDIKKLQEISLIKLDSKVREKLEKNKVLNRYTKHMDDGLKYSLIFELTKTVANAFMTYIGVIFFEKSKVNVEIQKDPRAAAVLQRFENVYRVVKNRSSAQNKQSIFNLRGLFKNPATSFFIRKMIISGKMEELTKTLIMELVNEYNGVIEKLAIAAEPPIKIPGDINPTGYVINYKSLLSKDTNL